MIAARNFRRHLDCLELELFPTLKHRLEDGDSIEVVAATVARTIAGLQIQVFVPESGCGDDGLLECGSRTSAGDDLA